MAHYVYKKLQQPVCNIDVVCKDRVLSCYMTLRDVENELWDNSMLSLHYRLKSETKMILESQKVEHLMGKMPRWVQEETVDECSACRRRFWMLLRKQHCRNCGNIFCKHCTTKKMFIPAYGYTKNPVRVCDKCFG